MLQVFVRRADLVGDHRRHHAGAGNRLEVDLEAVVQRLDADAVVKRGGRLQGEAGRVGCLRIGPRGWRRRDGKERQQRQSAQQGAAHAVGSDHCAILTWGDRNELRASLPTLLSYGRQANRQRKPPRQAGCQRRFVAAGFSLRPPPRRRLKPAARQFTKQMRTSASRLLPEVKIAFVFAKRPIASTIQMLLDAHSETSDETRRGAVWSIKRRAARR